MANVFDALSNETLQKVADGGDLWGSMTNEELQKIAAGGYDDPIPGMDQATQSAPAQPAQPAPRQRVSSYEEAIARAQQPGQGEGGFWSGVGEAISEGAKGAGRAVKEGVGGLVVNTVSGLTRLAGTPVRALTGWEGLHKLANAIDESYANFGAQALESEYGANPDGFGYGAGRFGEKLTGIAGNLGGLAAPGGIAKAAKAPAAIKTAAAAVQKSFPYMFGNNAAVQAYDTARENGKSKAEATALAGLNGAIHFLGFKAFENQSLNKMLGMPKSMEAMMPKWANEAMAESAPKTFTELARSVRNGMIKHTLAERGRGMLKAGGIMALQDMLSDVPMQVAEGGSWDNIDFNRVGKRGLEGLEEGALMEGAMGAAAMLRSNKSARNFLADKIYRNGYDVVSPSGKVYHEPGLLQTPQQRMALMKQNPDATERVLDIIEHGGVARPDELDAAFLPPDMSEKEQRKFAADWRKDLEPYVEQAWDADQSRGAGNEYFADREMSEANDAEGERRLLTAGEEKFQRQKKENDEQEAWNAKMLANEERKAKAGQDEYEQMMLEHEEARARQQPEEESRSGGEQPPPEQETPKQETPDETGNVRDEAPAQPEQGQVERPEPAAPVREEPRPMEGEPPRAEAPREGVVEPRGEGTAAEPPKTPQEPPKPAEVGKATPEPEKPVEVVSAAPAESPAPAERPAAEETPAPREETPVAEPEEKAAPVPTNRLKRADGTNPLAEKGQSKMKFTFHTSVSMLEHQAELALQTGRRSYINDMHQMWREWIEPLNDKALKDLSNKIKSGKYFKGKHNKYVIDAIEEETRRLAEERFGESAAPVPEEPAPEEPAPTNRLRRADGTDPLAERKTEVPKAEETKAEEPKPEDQQAYSGVPERLNESLSRLVTYDQETADDIAVLRKAAERNIKAGADDTPSEQDARSLRKRINQANANARESKRLGLADREKYFRDIAKDLKENLKELERNGIGEDADEVGWYRNADFNEIMDAIESGGASGSMHFDPYGIGRGAPGPFAEALKGIAESGVFTGKNLERFNRLAKKINDAYKRIESDIENPRGPFGEYLNDVSSQNTSKSAPESPAADTTPAPEATEPVEPVAKKESNRLRRADGTDPLAEKEAEAEAEKAEAKPGAMTAKQKAFRLNAMQKILGRIDPDVAIDPKALRRSQNNPNGFVLKDLKKLDDPANDGWQYELGLSKERADELRKAVHDAYEEQLAASPNRKDKTNETGQATYSVSASRALERLARNPKSIKQLGIAREQVLAAMTSAKERGDEQAVKFWEDKLSALNNQIGKLSPSDQNNVFKSIRDTQSMKSAMERKNTQSLESGEGKTLDVAAEDERIGRAIDEEAVAQTNSIRGGGGKGGALSGNRHLRIDKVDGDELTVTLMDAAGKPRGAAQKMNRTQWEMLGKAAAINNDIDGDPSNPQKGDMLRMSKAKAGTHDYANDADYQKWLKSRKANDAEPLRERYEQEQAKAAKSIARNTLPGVDVEIVDRAFNPETDGGVGERKSIGGIFTGSTADYANRSRQGGVDDGPSLHKIGTGEGSQVYGWGLYGSNQRGVAEEYANRGKYYKLKFDGKDIDQDGGTITAARALYESGMDYDKAVSNLKKQLAAKRRGMSVESVAISDAIEILESNKGRLSVEAPSKSYVYEQTFFADRAPGDESHLLSWYEPLGAQKAKTIVDGAKSLLMLHHLVDAETAKSGMAEKTVSEWTGKDLYKKMASAFGEEQASRMLRSMGIDGIKYPADSFGKSIKNGDRTGWDYVSFRDDNIRVDHKWEDGQMRYLRDGEGRIVGTFDHSTNKVKLYRGATAATLVHELGGHATLRFAEQEAERGNRQLLDRINRAIDEAPQALKDEIRRRYPGVDETALRDEIWAALRERNSPAMEKAIKTLQGKAWYNRAWSAFRDAWKGLLARMGFNRADLSQIDRMSNDEFLSHLDRIMSDGKTLGRLEAMGEGTRANPLAAGKPRGAAQKMNRTQWEMLGKAAAINNDIDGDPSNPQKGDMLRMSKAKAGTHDYANDADYQKWLKSRKANDAEPLRERYEQEQAKAAKSIARNTLPGVDVEIVDRAFNPETDGGVGERKSIGGIFTGSTADYANRSRQGGVDDGPSLKSIGTGEGTQVYGWGLYGSNRRGVAESYARAGKNKSARLEFDGKEWDENAGDWGVNSIMTSYLYANDPAYSNSNGGDFAIRLRRQAEIYKQQIDDIERNGKSAPEYIFLEKLRRAETMLSEAANDPKHTLDRIKEISPSAKVYEQTFFTDRAPGDESHLLKWYEPVSEENLKRINNQLNEEWTDPIEGDNHTGESVYEQLSGRLGGPKNASKFLARADIDGIKYPVNSYGKTLKDGDKAGWNYVSFRDDNIRVDHRWEDGQMRYLRDGEGRVVGTFDRSTNKITLYRGATAATLVHELGGHATLRFAEQEAERGNRQLLDRINRTIDEAPQALKDEIRRRYPGVDETALRDEIWAALRERNSPAMEKAIKTLQGKAWYNRAWSAFRDAWKGLLARMGFNRADLSQIDRMSNDEFLSHLDRIMSDGKTLGRLEAMGEGTRANPLAESQESVREARSPRPAGSRIMDDQQTKGEKFTEKFLDRLAPAQSVQDEIGGVEEIVGEDGYTDHRRSTDFVAAADKANGREEALTRNLQKKVDQVENDISQAALKGQDTAELLADFDLYAQCKHAAERNRTIAERNGVEYDADYYYGMGKVDRGGERVGLSENVANEIVRELREKYGDKFSHFEDAQKKLVEINREDIRNRVASGRLSAQDANQYLYRWQDYVPLKTDMAKLEPDGFNSSTASMRRNEFMKARGRGNADIADSPFAASVLQAEQGIRGSVKNELLNVAANLVEHAADKGNAIGEIVRGETLPKGAGWTFTLSDGTKVTAGGSMRLAENRPDVLLFKRNGELMAIRIDKGANGRGLALSKAISGENIGRWGSGTEWIPRMTHWMSAMRTQYSPEFIVSNLLSDHLEAYQALVGRYGIKGGSKTFAKMVASEIGNFKALRNYLNTGTMTRDVGEAVRAGLLTKGGVASEGFEGKEQSIRSHIEEFRRKQKKWRDMSAADWAKNGWSNIRDFISFANEMAEYSTRMGIFSALKKQGVPVKDAVKFARDATVNFNRKGTAMPLINGLYMFANASVQGTVRSVQAMRDEHGKELVGLLVGIGVAKAVLDNVLGDDEEREKSGGRSARNLSDYDRKHNVGVPIPGTDMQFAPLRFRGPYAAVPYIAQMATNVALGNQTPEQGAVKLVKELGDQVTDIVGGNGVVNDRGEIDGSLLMQSVAPSVADPIIQLASGKDYKGDERRAKEFDKTTPASSNGKRNTPFVYKKIAQGINAIPILSGGNENRKGRLDFAPEDIQLIVEFLGAGPARDIGNAVSTAQNVAELAKGGSPERTLSQVPFVRRVVKEYPENTTRYYNAIDSYERDKAEFNRTTDLKRRAEFGRAHPQVRPMVVDGKVQSKSRVDALNDRVKELMHLERGEIKNGRKWVERKTPITEAQKKSYHDRRLELQAKVLDILGA